MLLLYSQQMSLLIILIMLAKKNSQEIKPWTFRQRQTSIEFTEQSSKNAKISIKPFNLHSNNTLNANKFHHHNKIKTDSHSAILEKEQINYHNKLSRQTKENFVRYSQFIPNYKIIRFQNSNPKHPKSKSNSKNIDKYMPKSSYSNRQHFQELFEQVKRQQKSKSLQKIMKARRYYTEQKDIDPIKINLLAHKQPDLGKISKTQPTKKCQFAIKIIKTNKGIGISQEQVRGGQIYDKVQTILDSSGKQGGHLSQMKRNYNIKKLLRLLKEDHN